LHETLEDDLEENLDRASEVIEHRNPGDPHNAHGEDLEREGRDVFHGEQHGKGVLTCSTGNTYEYHGAQDKGKMLVPTTPLPKPKSTTACNICHIPFGFLVSHQPCGKCSREMCSGCSAKVSTEKQWWEALTRTQRWCNTCNEINVVWGTLRSIEFAGDALAFSDRRQRQLCCDQAAVGKQIGAGAFSTVRVCSAPFKLRRGGVSTRRVAAKLVRKEDRLVREVRCIAEEVAVMQRVGAGCEHCLQLHAFLR
jgi:hypothetical protein